MMRKLGLLIALSFVLHSTKVVAQKIAIVDINAILTDMPEFREAEKTLDKIGADWQQEIAQELDKVKSMYNKYQAEQVLLSDDIRQQKEQEIVNKEKEIRDTQRRRFGPEGELFDKRQQLVGPIQAQVFAAIDEYADDNGIDIIFDKNAASGILFTSEEYDKTAGVKKKLGLK